MSKKVKNELMLFNFGTTARTDYRDGAIKPVVKTQFVPKQRCLSIRNAVLKDVQTFADWKQEKPLFSLFHRPTEVTHTNPWDIQKPYSKYEDKERAQAQKTRPRLTLTPFINLDDIKNENARAIVIGDMYMTSTAAALQQPLEVAGPPNYVHAPLPNWPASANPVMLSPQEVPYVSPEWRMESASWERCQARSCVSDAGEYWRNRTLNCPVCKATSERKELSKLIRNTK